MRIGGPSGFDIRLHWSTAAVFLVLVFSLATVQLPADAPGYADPVYVVAASVAGLVFYLSLLAHEVSHAVMARRAGIEVQSLTLWMLGGIAALKGAPRDAAADLRVAAVGPLVSVVLSIAFGAAALGLDLVGAPAIGVATVAWLAGINGILALFNLIPAAPLDGGRILRAILWRVRGDRTWAAMTAARAGEVFGYVLIALGLARLLFGLDVGVGGLWFIVLGWFVLNAARQEHTQTQLRDALGDLTVRELMTPDPVTAPNYITLARLVDDYVFQTRHTAFPLLDFNAQPAGLVTLDQVRSVRPEERDEVRVRDVACGIDAVTQATPDERVLDVLPRLNGCTQGRTLVLDGGRLVGIVTPADVARAVERATLHGRATDVRERPEAVGPAGPARR